MDSFLSLFDPGVSDEPVGTAPLSHNIGTEENGNVVQIGSMTTVQKISALPPEPQIGNIEYKLKLINPSKQRFEHLVTQVRHVCVDVCVIIMLKIVLVRQWKRAVNDWKVGCGFNGK